MLKDRWAVRASVLRHADGVVKCGARADAGNWRPAESRPQIAQTLLACFEQLSTALTPFSAHICSSTITIEERDWCITIADSEPEVRAERALIARVVVDGPQSRVPVIWQAAGSSLPLDKFAVDVERGIAAEVRASLESSFMNEPRSCPVILDPWLASQLVHECIGHTSEADNFLDYALPRGYALGYRWCELALDVFDDPTLPDHRGSYARDHEGAPSRRTQLVRDGVWSSLLHNRQTQFQTGAAHRGNGRRVPGASATLPRMSVTFACAGASAAQPLSALIAQIEEGLYCVGTWGGWSSGPQFSIRPSYARRIRNGQLTNEFVRRFDLVGDKFATLAGLAGIGDQLEFFDPAFGCDKFGQDGLPITLGSSHLFLRSMNLRPILR